MCTIGRISTDEVFCLINSWNIIFQDIFYLCLKQRQLIHKAIIIKKKSVVVALARSISSKCILINDKGFQMSKFQICFINSERQVFEEFAVS